jgi:hypothetical protein
MNCREKIIQGRPYGGVGIIWKKDLSKYIKPVKTNCNRVCAVSLKTETINMLIVCVYFPCDNWSKSLVDELYIDCISSVKQLIESCDVNSVIVGGDLNTDLSRNTSHTEYLKTFMNRLHLKSIWDNVNAKPGPTYESYDGKSMSIIDNFLVSCNIDGNIKDAFVCDDVLNRSNHKPIHLHVNINNLAYVKSESETVTNSCDWDIKHASQIMMIMHLYSLIS